MKFLKFSFNCNFLFSCQRCTMKNAVLFFLASITIAGNNLAYAADKCPSSDFKNGVAYHEVAKRLFNDGVDEYNEVLSLMKKGESIVDICNKAWDARYSFRWALHHFEQCARNFGTAENDLNCDQKSPAVENRDICSDMEEKSESNEKISQDLISELVKKGYEIGSIIFSCVNNRSTDTADSRYDLDDYMPD